MVLGGGSRQTMANLWTYLLICLGYLISQSECNPSKRPVFKDDDCMESISLGMESGLIPDSSIWASTFGNKRLPSYGRLGRHSGAWSASTPNGEQFLAVDLGRRYIVTAVATQGRQGTEEYVAEFMLETSDDNSTWRVYTTELGIDEIFIGNSNGQDVKRNTLEFPIRARYIRFRPWRWSSSMSMRVEVYGCPFETDVAFFDGKSHISYDISNLPIAIHTTEDILRIHFKTNKPNGILFYTDGNQGDYLALELKRGYLYLHIDLGSTRLVRGGTTLVGGSMLDDHQWHDVLVQRKGKSIILTVDRLETLGEAAGDFFRLDLDSKLFVGGIPTFTKPGVTVRYNFYGCIENALFNGVKIIRDTREQRERFSVFGLIAYECQLEKIVPITFPTISASMDVIGEPSGVGAGTVRASLDFRTHNTDGLLFHHEFASKGFVKVALNSEGYVWYHVESQSGQIVEDIIRNNDVESPTKSFSDGLWHSLSLVVDTEKVNCTVDRNSIVSSRKLDVKAGQKYHLGGMETDVGFVGCMRHLDIANLPNVGGLPRGSTTKGVVIGTCGIRDRCTPNPCENDGVCYQTWSTFNCECDKTGYRGAVCHISAHYLSCSFYKMQNQNQRKEKIKIDLDGSGPLRPFEIECFQKDEDGIKISETDVSHNSESPVTVNGYDAPGSYVRNIRYSAGIEELYELVERSTGCEQFISYKCNNSRLFALPPDGSNAETYGWWVGRTFQPMYYWGKAAPGSKKCECGLTASGCEGTSTTCNCDAGLVQQKVDSGFLRHKEYLPVLELHFGDTGTVTDNKIGIHQLGKLKCEGDNLFENVVTFRKPDGVIKFPTFEAKSSGDIWFQFRTTIRDGVMIHCVGPKDYIRVEISSGNTIKFRFDAGDGERVLQIRTAAGLNDDRWHTIHVERNRKQAWLKVDTQGEEVWNEPPEQGPRTMDLSSPLVVGAAVGYQDGFVGCIRGLMVNGVLLDMRGMVSRGDVTYGLSEGCRGKCDSNPCFNGGTCYEGYSSYTCDCSYTPFRGWMCGREVGANMVPSHMITYKFDDSHGLSATDFEFAQIGFSTAKMQGILMQIRNAQNTEYISVEINNHGGVKMTFDIGYGRDEINTENHGISYANNQQHVVTIHITERGRRIKMQVDNYDPTIKIIGVAASADTILNDPAIMYIGRNDSMPLGKGFEGCIYRMQVQNIFPLKRVFQDPRPNYISLTPKGMIREDMCGFEEITQSPDPVETRPPDESLVNITYPVTFNEGMALYERVIVGVVLTLFILILIIVLYIICYHTKQKGDYETKEAKGADLADNPDMAVMYNQEGLPIPKRKEWFV